MLHTRTIHIACLFLALAWLPGHATELATGRVLAVESGDQIRVLFDGGAPLTVHLAGLRAPPVATAWAENARRHLQMLVAGKPVSIETLGADATGRHAIIRLGGEDMGRRLISAGLAAVDATGMLPAEVLASYRQAQQRARSSRRGFWSEIEGRR